MADRSISVTIGSETFKLGLSDLGGGVFGIKTSDGSGGGTTLGTANYAEVSVTDEAIEVVAANLSRKSLLIQNNSDTDEIYLNTGTPIANGGSLKLKAGAAYSTGNTGEAYNAIAATGKTVSVTIEEIS